ncbi:MAG: hypothetical protein V3W18_14715 [candidate division Zixibacteria bacterium]
MKPIILIGGTSGTGKSRLARELCSGLCIDHRLGTGFIREIVKSETSEKEESILYKFTFQSDDAIQNVVYQSERLYKAIISCVNRAKNEGTSLIIEGPHLLPKLYYKSNYDSFFILASPESKVHSRRIKGPSHGKRIISNKDFKNARSIDNYLKLEANNYKIPCLIYCDNYKDFANLITEKAKTLL